MKALAKFIMRGHIQATLSVIVSTLLSFIIPPLSILGGASIGLFTLRQGELAGLLVIIASSLLFGLAAMTSSIGTAILPNLLPLLVVFIVVWFLAVILRRLQSLPITITVACLFGLIYVIGFHLSVDDIENWWQIRLAQYFAPAIEQVGEKDQQAIYQFISIYAPQITGLLAATMVFYSILCLFMARWWQALLYNPQGFQQEFHNLRFGKYVAIFTLFLIAMNFIPTGGISHLSRDGLTVVLFTIYLLQGLAIGHFVIASKKLHRVWFVALYFVAIFSYPLVAVLGFIDTWFDFRKRFTTTSQAT